MYLNHPEHNVLIGWLTNLANAPVYGKKPVAPARYIGDVVYSGYIIPFHLLRYIWEMGGFKPNREVIEVVQGRNSKILSWIFP